MHDPGYSEDPLIMLTSAFLTFNTYPWSRCSNFITCKRVFVRMSFICRAFLMHCQLEVLSTRLSQKIKIRSWMYFTGNFLLSTYVPGLGVRGATKNFFLRAMNLCCCHNFFSWLSAVSFLWIPINEFFGNVRDACSSDFSSAALPFPPPPPPSPTTPALKTVLIIVAGEFYSLCVYTCCWIRVVEFLVANLNRPMLP